MNTPACVLSIAVLMCSCSDGNITPPPPADTQVFVRLDAGQPAGTEAGGTIPSVRYRAVDQNAAGVANVNVNWTIIGPMNCYPSCSSAGALVSPSQSTILKPPPNTVDSAFLSLNREIPGFGGFFFDEHGNVNVMLKDSSSRDVATRRLAQMAGLYRGQGGMRGAGQVIVRPARFDFGE